MDKNGSLTTYHNFSSRLSQEEELDGVGRLSYISISDHQKVFEWQKYSSTRTHELWYSSTGIFYSKTTTRTRAIVLEYC